MYQEEDENIFFSLIDSSGINNFSKKKEILKKLYNDIGYNKSLEKADENLFLFKNDEEPLIRKGFKIDNKQAFFGTFILEQNNNNNYTNKEIQYTKQEGGILIEYDDDKNIQSIKIGDFSTNENIIELKIIEELENDNKKKDNNIYSYQIINPNTKNLLHNNLTLSNKQIYNLITNEIKNELIQKNIKNNNKIGCFDEITKCIIEQSKKPEEEKSWFEKIFFCSCSCSSKEPLNEEITTNNLSKTTEIEETHNLSSFFE